MNIEAQLDLSILLGIEARRMAPTIESIDVLGIAAQRTMLLKGMLRSEAGLWDVAFSPHGDVLAAASDDNTIILWDPVTGRQIGEPLEGHTDPVSSVAFSPDGDMLASASEDKSIILWDPATGKADRGAPGGPHSPGE